MKVSDIYKYKDDQMEHFDCAEDAIAFYLYSLAKSVDRLTKTIKDK